jgi:hypothetical protein
MKQIFNGYQKFEINSCILLDHSRVKLDIKSKRNNSKYSNAWRLSTALLHCEGNKKISRI